MFERAKSLLGMQQVRHAGIDSGTRPQRKTPEDVARLTTATANYRAGDLASAERVVATLIEQNHDWSEAHFLMGEIRRKEKRWDDASDCYTLAICFNPEFTEARVRLGLVLLEQNKAKQAAETLEHAIQFEPQNAEALNALGMAYVALERVSEAEGMFRRAVVADPRFADAHSNLGYLLVRDLEKPEEGSSHIELALSLVPGHSGALCNQVMAHLYLGRLDEALCLSEKLLQLQPTDELRLTRAIMLLTRGDFEKGWPDYELRKNVRSNYANRVFDLPAWLGRIAEHRTVLVHAEQGLGDQIMFASCLPDLATATEHCIVECDHRLQPIFARSFPTMSWHAQRDGAAAWSSPGLRADAVISMGSLPLHFRRSAASFPQHSGYLKADESRVAFWKKRLASFRGRLKVGISWKGGARSTRQSTRSIPLSQWLPILNTPDVDFVSLQYTDCDDELAQLDEAHGIQVHQLPDAIDNYDETAALVQALDLVISVQTAIVHLGGALGQRVWALIAAVPEWRYLNHGDAMPWYPSVRLFRQSTVGDWSGVVSRVARELSAAIPFADAL